MMQASPRGPFASPFGPPSGDLHLRAPSPLQRRAMSQRATGPVSNTPGARVRPVAAALRRTVELQASTRPQFDRLSWSVGPELRASLGMRRSSTGRDIGMQRCQRTSMQFSTTLPYSDRPGARTGPKQDPRVPVGAPEAPPDVLAPTPSVWSRRTTTGRDDAAPAVAPMNS